MNNLLNNNFTTSIPLVSVFASILYLVYENIGLYILAMACLVIPAIVFLLIAIYLFVQFERILTIEIELDTVQLGLIQLATILVSINSLILIFK